VVLTATIRNLEKLVSTYSSIHFDFEDCSNLFISMQDNRRQNTTARQRIELLQPKIRQIECVSCRRAPLLGIPTPSSPTHLCIFCVPLSACKHRNGRVLKSLATANNAPRGSPITGPAGPAAPNSSFTVRCPHKYSLRSRSLDAATDQNQNGVDTTLVFVNSPFLAAGVRRRVFRPFTSRAEPGSARWPVGRRPGLQNSGTNRYSHFGRIDIYS